MGRLVVILFVVFCFVVAGATYTLAIHQPNQTVQSAVAVEGTVQSTGVETDVGPDETRYVPKVTYRYRFEGETYTNDAYGLRGTSFPTPMGAEEAIEPYSPGEPVTVYVVSHDPTTTFLERTPVGLHVYGILAAFVALGLLGVVALVDDLLGWGYVDIE